MLGKEKKIILVLLFIFLQTSPKITEFCQKETDFDKKYAANLDKKRLKDLYALSKQNLGSGSFGVVKEISWTEMGKKIPVAVKQIILVDPERFLPQVEKEISAMKKFQGIEAVIQMKGCMVTKEVIPKGTQIGRKKANIQFEAYVIYIVIEKLYASFLESPELGEKSPLAILQKKDPLDRIKIYLKMAEALHTLHLNDFVHSDFKTANVMTAKEDIELIKLIDLGFSDNIGKQYRGSTPIIQPIEGWKRQPLQPSFDIYSFAVTVAEVELSYDKLEAAALPYFKLNDKTDFVKSVYRLIENELPLVKNFGTLDVSHDNFSKIIIDCLNFNASKRPSGQNLIKRIKAFVSFLEGKTGPLIDFSEDDYKENMHTNKPERNQNSKLILNNKQKLKLPESKNFDFDSNPKNSKELREEHIKKDNLGAIVGVSVVALISVAVTVFIKTKSHNR